MSRLNNSPVFHSQIDLPQTLATWKVSHCVTHAKTVGSQGIFPPNHMDMIQDSQYNKWERVSPSTVSVLAPERAIWDRQTCPECPWFRLCHWHSREHRSLLMRQFGLFLEDSCHYWLPKQFHMTASFKISDGMSFLKK